jgi:murein L,D-transpeptidase YcbB/YkuD
MFTAKHLFVLLVFLQALLFVPAIHAQPSDTTFTGVSGNLHERLSKMNLGKFNQGKMLLQFYEEDQLAWFSSFADTNRRNSLTSLISNADLYALNPASYHLSFLSNKKDLKNSVDSITAEFLYTDAALSFMHDLAYGGDYNFVQYNAIKYHPNNLDLIAKLRTALNSKNFIANVTRVEPSGDKYNCLKQEYLRMLTLYKKPDFKDVLITSKDIKPSNVNLVIKLRQLGYLADNDTTSLGLQAAYKKFQQQYSLLVQPKINEFSLQLLNEPLAHKLEELTWNIRWYRWMNLMKNKRFIAINIPENRLAFFNNGEVKLDSKMVVGKTSTPTPTLISEIKNVIYYPYWNVPNSIATKEILPILKRRPGYLQTLKLDVLVNEKLVNGSAINWRSYSRSYFPFQLRQRPGCHNSLGRLKFHFENPYHVYIHDTNVKLAFLSKKRFLSHGCMRIEKPFELAVLLGVPSEKIDMSECLDDKKPEVIPLPKPVPVFVIYATIDVVEGQLQWFEDAYHKIRKLK